jgi:nucleoid-associated protein YgaU
MKLILALFVVFLMVPVIGLAEMTEKDAQAELLVVQAKIAEAEAKVDMLESTVKELKEKVDGLESHRDELGAKLADLQEQWRRCTFGRYKVVEGDWLCTIAAKRNIYNKASMWPTIYEANKDKIKNPNRIYPEWVLLIPTLDKYTVVGGDYLSLIASYLSIYSDAKKWPMIYEANKTVIKDPDRIYPKQNLLIPHE